MKIICKVCGSEKNTPYKEICRACYQTEWLKTIPIKKCSQCHQEFKTPGRSCHSCQYKVRKEASREIQCLGCNRVGVLVLNKTEILCITCDRKKKESLDPEKLETRRRQVRECSRRKKGTDLNAPIRKTCGWWKNSQGYIMVFKKGHPNANVNGCALEHVVVMSEKMARGLTKDEFVHHLNGVRDDNRPENLELWSKSHPPGQRVEDKIKWAKEILEKYGEKIP